jgi:hypothetical protein
MLHEKRDWSRRTAGLGGLFLVLVLAVACGDDSGGNGEGNGGGGAGDASVEIDSPFDSDACDLLTDDQVAELLGDGSTSESTAGDAATSTPSACTWSAADQTLSLTEFQVTGVTIFLGDELIYQNTLLGAEESESYEEPDLGDAAFAGDSSGGILIGDVGITVTPIGVDINDPQAHDVVVDLLDDVAADR